MSRHFAKSISLFFLGVLQVSIFSQSLIAEEKFKDLDGTSPCDRKKKFSSPIVCENVRKRGTVIVKKATIDKKVSCDNAGLGESQQLDPRDIPGHQNALNAGVIEHFQGCGPLTAGNLNKLVVDYTASDRKRIEAGKESELCPDGGTPKICYMKDPKDKIKAGIYIFTAEDDGDGKANVSVACPKVEAYVWYRCEGVASKTAAVVSPDKICFTGSSGLDGLCLESIPALSNTASVTPTPTPIPQESLEDTICDVVNYTYETGGIDAVTTLIENHSRADAEKMVYRCGAVDREENSYYALPPLTDMEPTSTPAPVNTFAKVTAVPIGTASPRGTMITISSSATVTPAATGMR